MGTTPKKNTKWIVFGSIILILAILIAVGPILVTKYMRAKWQDGPKYKTSSLTMQVNGKLQMSNDNTPYLVGDNGLFYVLEDLQRDIQNNIGESCSVLGKIRIPKNNETVDGNPVRLFIGVQKINFKNENKDDVAVQPTVTVENKEVSNGIKEKSLKKNKLRVEVNAVLNKAILFDVIKGKVSSQNRKTLDGEDFVALILSDEFGDNYMLYDKKMKLQNLEGKEIICLGREILPPVNMPLVVDEVAFEIYEVYDYQYNKIM